MEGIKLQKEHAEKSMSPEKSLVQERIEESAVAPVVLAIGDMFYIVIMFAAWYLSESFLLGASILVGIFMMTIIMCQVCIAGYDENHTFMQSLLVYFPVNAKRLRRELFLLMWKYIGIQVGITCVPMLINMFIDFQPNRFFKTLGAVVLSMLVTGTLIILGSMSRMKAEV